MPETNTIRFLGTSSMTRYEGTRSLPDGRDFGETGCTGGPVSLPMMSAYVLVPSQTSRYISTVRFGSAEKAPVIVNLFTSDSGAHSSARYAVLMNLPNVKPARN